MPLIAIDLDDVLAQTNARVAELHNAEYGTNWTLEDFKYYHYWRNRGWGTPQETMAKVKSMYARGLFADSAPIPGAFEALSKLKIDRPDLKIVIITARGEAEREGSELWIAKNFPGIFDNLYFTGSFTHVGTDGEGGPPLTKTSHPLLKSEVITRLGAALLIDDSIENAFDVGTATDVPVLLFSLTAGGYPWNLRTSSKGDELTYEQAVAAGRENEGLVDDKDLPKNVRRVNGWNAVIEQVKGILAY